MIAIDISKQQAALNANPRAIQQIKLTGSLDWARQIAMYFIIEEAKETDFSQGTVIVLWMCFTFWYNIIKIYN